jgi:hypothetical protein
MDGAPAFDGVVGLDHLGVAAALVYSYGSGVSGLGRVKSDSLPLWILIFHLEIPLSNQTWRAPF